MALGAKIFAFYFKDDSPQKEFQSFEQGSE